MYFSALIALNRKDRKHVVLASAAHTHAGGDTSKVAAAYREIVAGKDGPNLRAKYSNIMFMMDNQVRNVHAFPDPVKQEADTKAAAQEQAARQLEKARAHILKVGNEGNAAMASYNEAVAKARAAGVVVPADDLAKLFTTPLSEIETAEEKELLDAAADKAAEAKAAEAKAAEAKAAEAKAAAESAK